ncbi:hypothetical protein H2O64_22240 [Kordia sp. YSTF-M3]|uniref:Uncharacterized protein n=1 Tax=Kordia aestuariivivens TaxID=2759037 RepID=A0ABR7QFS7_9FLAO|nr:hypothetical protein [Kordia aestuariivivens]MBC8757406.1 hypothetical protein [Kordia aestuariivivens]
MKIIICTLLVFVSSISYSQSPAQVKVLLDKITTVTNSKNIIKSKEAKKLISYNKRILLLLSFNFADDTKTSVVSDCLDRKLTRGEIAMIIADHIDRMPYFQLTGVQNCTVTFCVENPNFIEYYFWWLKTSSEKVIFRNKYITYIGNGELIEPIHYPEINEKQH